MTQNGLKEQFERYRKWTVALPRCDELVDQHNLAYLLNTRS